MTKYALLMIFALSASPLMAQEDTIDLPANGDVSNLVPIAAGSVVGLLVVAAVGGSSSSTTSTGSTTGTGN